MAHTTRWFLSSVPMRTNQIWYLHEDPSWVSDYWSQKHISFSKVIEKIIRT